MDDTTEATIDLLVEQARECEECMDLREHIAHLPLEKEYKEHLVSYLSINSKV